MTWRGEWTVRDLGFELHRCPKVPRVQIPVGGWCHARHPEGYMCSRPEGHTGRHAAHGRRGAVFASWWVSHRAGPVGA